LLLIARNVSLAEFGAEIAARLRNMALGRGRVPGEINEDAIRGDRDAAAAMNTVVGEGVLEAAEATAQRASVAQVRRRLLPVSPRRRSGQLRYRGGA
jgi:hypothetical protein